VTAGDRRHPLISDQPAHHWYWRMVKRRPKTSVIWLLGMRLY